MNSLKFDMRDSLINLFFAEENDESVHEFEKLLRNGLDPNSTVLSDDTNPNQTLLEYCCRWNRARYIDLLVKYHVNLEVFTADNDTPLHLLAYQFRDIRSEAPSYMNIEVSSGICIGQSSTPYLNQTYELLLKKLIHLINYQGYAKRTALMLAAKSGALDIIELLLKYGADVNVCDEFENNCLHYCLMENSSITSSLKAINLLVSAGTDQFKKNTFGKTPIETYLSCHPPLAETPFGQLPQKAISYRDIL